MGKILKEMSIIRKYSTNWEIIKALLTIPAATTVTVTYNPPEKKTYVFDYSTVGPQTITNLFSSDVFWDGTRSGVFISQGALSDKALSQGEAPLKMAINELKIVIENADTVAHTTDVIFWGFLIDRGREEEMVYELQGQDIKDQNTHMINLLTQINERLGGAPIPPPAPPPPAPPPELPPPLPPEPPAKREWWHLADALSRQDELLEQILRAIQKVPPPAPTEVKKPVEVKPPETQSSGSYDNLIEKLNKWYENRRSKW